MNVGWNKCEGDKWCLLNSVNLDHSHFEGLEGVYIIWHAGVSPATVRVGQGVIKERLAVHRNDKDIQSFSDLGLYVTWASVATFYRDGIEAFLAEQLNPKVGDRFPDRKPIEVNLPWNE
jgi:hypothetical protein